MSSRRRPDCRKESEGALPGELLPQTLVVEGEALDALGEGVDRTTKGSDLLVAGASRSTEFNPAIL
ncbi:hypothetical protein [Streptomyces pratensis]|uniref:hypothetical protein n=1 Tax=Streptomyces pratensis TaxID=1169025 RepID=UPI00362BAF06